MRKTRGIKCGKEIKEKGKREGVEEGHSNEREGA